MTLNIFANCPREYLSGSFSRSSRIFAIVSSEARSGLGLCVPGREKGGNGPSTSVGMGLRRGEQGLVVNECGEAAEGGGRWMKVKFSSSSVTVALGLLTNGSGGRYAGRSAVPGFGRGNLRECFVP